MAGKYEPIEFTIEHVDGGFELRLGGTQIRTRMGGHPVAHPARDLLRHMVDELSVYPYVELTSEGVIEAPNAFGALALFGLQKEWIESARDNVTEDFTRELLSDGFWTRLPGPEAADQWSRYLQALKWLRGIGAEWADRDFVTIPGVWESPYFDDRDTEAFLRAAEVLRRTFEDLDPEQKAVCVFLHNLGQGNLVHAMALSSGAISPVEYAVGTLATQAIFIAMPDVRGKGLTKSAKALAEDAAAGVRYIHAYRSGTAIQRLLDLIEAGEATNVEFKSTLRFDIGQQAKNRAITDAVVKTVAGFLNTSGGTLVIGVDDHGQPVGIEQDGFDTEDAFLRHFYTSITNALGPAAAPLVNATPLQHAGRTVVLVDCQRGARMFPAKQRNGASVVYVRTGPATIALNEDQVAEWEATHARWSGAST